MNHILHGGLFHVMVVLELSLTVINVYVIMSGCFDYQECSHTMARREPCTTLGTFLAGRLVEIGVTHVFGVPGKHVSSS